MRNKRRLIIIGAITAVVLLAAAAFAFGWFNGDQSDSNTTIETSYSKLTGEEVSAEESNRPILGVIIENTPQARPQAGLDSAGIVFETVTEGGITRFLALYQTESPDDIGPIRSLRPYFLDWAMGFDAAIAHVGGSAVALQQAEQREDARSLNQFNYPDPYYRTDDREPPHNMFANTGQLRDLMRELGYTSSNFASIPRKSDMPADAPDAEQISIDFSTTTYQVEFRYQQEMNNYVRYLAGEPHVDDATNEPIAAKNVIVLKMPRSGVEAVGSGEALVFMDGSVQTVRWQKSSFDERVKVIDSDGNELALNRGDSWIMAVPSDRRITH